MERRFGIGDMVAWETLNGEACGRVVALDRFGLGYMAVKLAGGRRMLVHERSARPGTEIVGDCAAGTLER